MAETSTNNSSHPTKKRGVIGKSIDFIFKILGVLVFSALISILIEWIGMTFFYPDEGYRHAEEMMHQELGYLGASVDGDKTNSRAVAHASEWITDFVDVAFVNSGVLEGLQSVKTIEPNDGKIIRVIKGLLAEYHPYLMAAVFITIMFMVRLSILVLSIPAFVMFGVVGLTDGLMQRDLRRWCGGNESGFIYHWAKKFALPVLVIAWILYLAIPNSVHPNLIITPFAVLFGLVIMVMASKFKKYL